jgi:hypothetical protein
MNMEEQSSLRHTGFISLIPRTGTARSYIILFLLSLVTLHTLFHNFCSNLHSQELCVRFPFLHTFPQHLSFVLIRAIQVDGSDVLL